MEENYLRACLREIRYALPASAVLKILSAPVVIPVPDAPEGICGLVYDRGTVLPLRSFCPQVRRPSRLVILWGNGTQCEALAADRVETMGPLSAAELDAALPLEDAGILLLRGEGTHDPTER